MQIPHKNLVVSDKVLQLWIWLHLLKKLLVENFIFCAVLVIRRN